MPKTPGETPALPGNPESTICIAKLALDPAELLCRQSPTLQIAIRFSFGQHVMRFQTPPP
jgi:hypothetical protein